MRATWPCPVPSPLSSTPEPTTYGQTPSVSSPRKSPTVVRLTAHMRPRVRACAIRALATTPSRPVGPGAHIYKRRPPPCILSAPLASPSTGKGATASAPVSTTGSPLPDLTSLPLSSSTSPGAPTHFGEAPRGVAEFPDYRSHPAPPPHTGELRPSVARLPRFELELLTMSDRFTVRLVCSR
jgi:hypothetical protein